MCAIAFMLLGASCENAVPTGGGKAGVPENSPDAFTVMFYNVENLFDIYDDPKKIDEEFTPDGKYKWNEERYQTKLDRLSEVVDAIPGALPAFVGMCEIENRAVLRDLVAEEKLLPGHYAIIHKDSPDERGIDVAAIYDSTRMKVESFYYTTINLPNEADPYTRDLLYVKANVGGDIFHLFVNHWPSRSGGQVESEGNRIAVANVLESLVGKILASDAKAKILLMGDFNDYPTDKSIAQVLNAGVAKENTLFNFMYDDHAAKEGSYYYKGEWGALDQFMASRGLKNAKKGYGATEDAAHIFKNDLVLFTDKEGVKRPNRTYVGEDYKAGYSDHLPVYIELRKH